MRLASRTRRFTAAGLGMVMLASLGLASAATSTAVPLPKAWFSLDSELDGGITATAVVDGVLYAGGWFTTAGGQAAEGVATFDGTTWTPLPSSPGFEVDSLATDGTNLYAGGSFYDFGPGQSSPGGVAVWDGTDWTDLTGDLPAGSWISAIVPADGDVFAFGFSYVDPGNPGTRTCLALQMTGSAPGIVWNPVGNLVNSDCMINDAVLSRSGTSIYVVGDFSDVMTGPAAGFGANGVARYDIGENAWYGYGDGTDFGNGMGSPFAVVEGATAGDLVVAGTFSDGTDDSALAMWNPDTEWTMTPGFTGDDGVAGTALTWDGPDLYVGGYFEGVDGTTLNGIARWDGTTFHALGAGVTYPDGTYAEADTIAPYGGKLIVSGDFEVAGTVDAMGVAYYANALVPGAPRAVKATAGATYAKVTWTAPVSDGGAAITSYAVTAAPGGRTCTAAAPTRACTVTGLTPGTTYRFTVKAKNAVGTGPASAASAGVPIPKPPVVKPPVVKPPVVKVTYRTITARVLYFPGDSRIGPKGAATLRALTARVPAGAKVTWVKVTGYVQGTMSRFGASDAALAVARAQTAARWLTRHGVGGGYTVGSGGVAGNTGLARAAVVAIRYVVPTA